MKTTTLRLKTPNDFNFWRTVYSHGWCTLAPFGLDKEHSALQRVLFLSGGPIVHCTISHQSPFLTITASCEKELSNANRTEIRASIASCLRMQEDFSKFYSEIRKYPKYRWIAKMKAGRMLRSPSVFEDIVKMICTTNCSWALTEIMTTNLVNELGTPFDSSLKSFPQPEALAGVSEQFMRKTIRSGYRSPYLLELAESVASGKLRIEEWRSTQLPTEILFKQLRSIKGVGEYAAGNLLKLLGRYDYLGLDSWVRGQYYSLYHQGRSVSDSTIERRYARFGSWRGLFFWLEMTKHWYDRQFPF